MQLPEAFNRYTRQMMGEQMFAKLTAALNEVPPVSIRLNPKKTVGMVVAEGSRVPWCNEGYYLVQRPQFTFDPLLHSGCYYVQEASSMFITHVLRSLIPQDSAPLSVLDLCAAPGGKSTAALTALPAGSKLISNEPMRQRAKVLGENIAKWGADNCTVTSMFPKEFQAMGELFDVVIADVPCSGEGMFRKDPKAADEWSTDNVERCRKLQRVIVADIWPCLKRGGLMVYSTCTYNTRENEENVGWITASLGAELLQVPTQQEWQIKGSLLDTLQGPVYRFIPGMTKGEGLFMAAMRKDGGDTIEKGVGMKEKGGGLKVVDVQASTAQAESVATEDISYTQALSYLRGEAIVLRPDAPRGIVTVAFQGHPLGPVKNIGTRANNLYPKEWRIKTTHMPDTYSPILKPITRYT
ncbi:MAG: hypothetical protein IJP74_10300 [Prevotella sp.]|nr:hypothetical protein [Prevotella sp.]